MLNNMIFLLLSSVSTITFAMFSKPYNNELVQERQLFFSEYSAKYAEFVSEQDSSKKMDLGTKAYMALINAADLQCPKAITILSERQKVPYHNESVKLEPIFKTLRTLRDKGSMHAEIELMRKLPENDPLAQCRVLTGIAFWDNESASNEFQRLTAAFRAKNYPIVAYERALYITDKDERLKALKQLEKTMPFVYAPLIVDIFAAEVKEDLHNDDLLPQVLELIAIGSNRAKIAYAHTLLMRHEDRRIGNKLDNGILNEVIVHLENAIRDGFNEAHYWLGKCYACRLQIEEALFHFQLVVDEEFVHVAKKDIQLFLLWQHNPSLIPAAYRMVQAKSSAGRLEEIASLESAFKEHVARLKLSTAAQEAKSYYKKQVSQRESSKENIDANIVKSKTIVFAPKPKAAPLLEENNSDLTRIALIFKKVKNTVKDALLGEIVDKQDYVKFINVLKKIEGKEKLSAKKNSGSHYKLKTEHGNISASIKHKSSSDRSYTYAIQAVFAKIAKSLELEKIRPADLGY